MNEHILRAERVSVRHRHQIVLKPFNLTVDAGEVVGIYGPNGAGKSTLLQALAGLLPLASGQITFRGRVLGRGLSLLEYHRQMAALFQEPLLLRGTVWHNVTLGLRLRGIPSAEQSRRVEPWLERLKIAHLAGRSVKTLSGGEAQRASLARALVLEPDILFLDEPFAALDAPTRFRLVGELEDILGERHIVTLFVTHDLAEASALCHRCLVLDRGEVLQEEEPSTILHRPSSRRVAEITGTENIFEGVVTEVRPEGGVWLDWQCQRLLASTAIAPIGKAVTFVIRQEDMEIQSVSNSCSTNSLRGHVQRIRRRGQGALVSVQVGNPCLLHVFTALQKDLAPGQSVTVTFSPQAISILQEDEIKPEA